MQPNHIITYVYTVWKKDISTVTFKNKLATSIICSNIELTKTQVLPQNTTLLEQDSLHFSLSKIPGHSKTLPPAVSCTKQASGCPLNAPTKLLVVTFCFRRFKARCSNAEHKKLKIFSVIWDVSIQYHSLLHTVLTS